MKKHSYIRIGIVALLIVLLSATSIPSALANALATMRNNAETPSDSDSNATSVQPLSSASFEKSEAVYANLTASGDTAAMYVINRFDVTEAGTIADFGDYQTVQNLTDETGLVHNDDAIIFETDQGTFFYQGNAVQKALPWNISIEYELDGQKIAPEDLIGASGDLSIQITTTRNEEIDAAFYDSFMVQITFTLPGDAVSDIQAQGTLVSPVIAEAGEDKTVAFAALPKHDGTFELTARVEDFHMPSAQIVALPYSMVLDMPDTDAMIDDMGALVDAIEQLSDGTSELASGIDQLADGAQDLSSGTAEFGAGLNELNNSSAALVQASGQIKQVFDILSLLLDKVDISQIDQLEKLPEDMYKLASALDRLAATAKEVQEGYTDAMDDLDTAIEQLQDNAATEEEIRSLQEYVKDDPKQAKTVEKLLTSYKVAQSVSDIYKTGKPVFDRVGEIFDTLVPILEQQGDYVRDIADQIQTLIDEGAIDQIPQLLDGVKQMLSQYGRFHDGLVQYTSGVSALAANYNQLQSGTASLASGASDLSGGGRKLADGMYELNSAVALIPETMREEIKSMTEEFDFSQFDPVSFTSPKNEHMAAVQFVIATEALEKPEPHKEKEPEQKQTSWDRFLALFS